MQQSTEARVEKPIRAVEEVSNVLSFNHQQSDSILKHCIQDNHFSRWGLANAVTRAAENASDYDI